MDKPLHGSGCCAYPIAATTSVTLPDYSKVRAEKGNIRMQKGLLKLEPKIKNYVEEVIKKLLRYERFCNQTCKAKDRFTPVFLFLLFFVNYSY